MKKVSCLIITLLLIIFVRTDLKAQEPFSIPQLIVSPDWLAENLSEPQLVILHYGKAVSFYRNHIPGARLVSIEPLLVEGDNNLTHEFPDQSSLIRILRSWGINQDSRIVVCFGEENGLIIACRLLLTLEYAGLEGSIALLNGGLQAWKEEGRELTKAVAGYKEGNVNVTINNGMLADRNFILDHLEAGNVVLVDARPEEQYSGKIQDHNAPRKGHIKGAVNIPFIEVTSEEASYKFKSATEIRALFEAHSIRLDSRIVTYCGSGIWASPVYIAARWLGYKVLFYDASFQEWGSDYTLPILSDM